MLKFIIKRDGRTEPFTPSKVNNWSKWATQSIGDRIDWSSLVLEAVSRFSEKASSQDLQKALILACIQKGTWPANLMAGRLYAATYRKELYDEYIPTVRALQHKLFKAGLMKRLSYTTEEYGQIETFIQHDRDFEMAQFQLKQLRVKYAVQNRKGKIEYETPQFIFMRMAMALAEGMAGGKLEQIQSWYNDFSEGIINAPSPNYINLGTLLNSFSSCCLYVAGDTIDSLNIGDTIAYKMTAASSGIGGIINCRSMGDPVRGGSVVHNGKLPYLAAVGKNIKANIQAGRSGACTQYISVFDPEASDIIQMQNPRTPQAFQNRDIHVAVEVHPLMARKALLNQDIFTFNCHTAPDLHKAFYGHDQEAFEKLYNEYEANPSFKKNYVSARKLALDIWKQGHEVSTLYMVNIHQINYHTPFKEPIYSANLCTETCQPAAPYYSLMDLYSEEDHGRGEISTCNLAAINIAANAFNTDNKEESDNRYFRACYNALKMIDQTILTSDYVFPHLKFTAHQRMNAGVGILGQATYLARKGLKYDTQEGLEEMHRLAERHMYFLIKASLTISKERGVAPWIHKTKWPEGWLPIDTYKQEVDEIVPHNTVYDWEVLRQEIIANGGIAHSTLCLHMPTESSSKATGAPNGLYPIRDLTMAKSDQTNVIDWVAVDSDLLQDAYHIAWDISTKDMIKGYAVWQKWTDQAISADFYKNRIKNPQLSEKEMLEEFHDFMYYGNKSKYYQNSLINDDVQKSLSNQTSVAVTVKTETTPPLSQVKEMLPPETPMFNPSFLEETTDNERGCVGGVCTC